MANRKGTTVTLKTVKDMAKKHLAMIGRRLNQNPGDKTYSKITFTANEADALDIYIMGAFSYLASTFPESLTAYNGGTESYGVGWDASRFSNNDNNAMEDAIKCYAFSYCISSYLAMFNADLAKKYQSEAGSYLQAIRNIAYTKSAPTPSSSNLADITGTIS